MVCVGHMQAVSAVAFSKKKSAYEVDDAFANNIQVAVCSTSNVNAVTTIVRTLLGEERLAKIEAAAADSKRGSKEIANKYEHVDLPTLKN